ncbi:uncharacterized SAM-binding protein YcdF (DUF218 family) [Streptococcus rupicaprae]|uniref:Uncharacterized SAM-binding protein YcdF (DUF218 family) n=1 Tax=Streptococcus rupicaprae TaxID=759619 RepID=A0ABV2FIV3_9STRE
MKPIISKTPAVPKMSQKDIEYLTDLIFGPGCEPALCDALFIFSGTHHGHWQKAIEAYKKGYCQTIIVTGGKSLTGKPHPDWKGNTEADVIVSHLLKAGVPQNCIVSENRSTNSLENVIHAKEIFNFNSIQSLMVICKSHATGRQLRTLDRHLPKDIKFIPYSFDTTYQDVKITRHNWMLSEVGKSRVWGEYLRIKLYGERGDITSPESYLF